MFALISLHYRMAACFSSVNEASANDSTIFSLSSSALSLTDVFPRQLLHDLVFEELEDFLELLYDDFFDEILLDINLLLSSTPLIQLYILYFWVNTTSSTVSNQSSSSSNTSCGSRLTYYLCKDTKYLNWSLKWSVSSLTVVTLLDEYIKSSISLHFLVILLCNFFLFSKSIFSWYSLSFSLCMDQPRKFHLLHQMILHISNHWLIQYHYKTTIT